MPNSGIQGRVNLLQVLDGPSTNSRIMAREELVLVCSHGLIAKAMVVSVSHLSGVLHAVLCLSSPSNVTMNALYHIAIMCLIPHCDGKIRPLVCGLIGVCVLCTAVPDAS